MERLQLWVNGHSTGYNQQEGVHKIFAYSSAMRQGKMTLRFIHSLYEKASSYPTQVCETYFNFEDFKGRMAHGLEWDSNILFDDLLLLQVMEIFPNFAIPNVKLSVYIDLAGLVWRSVDPQAGYDYKVYLEEAEINYKLQG